MCLKRKEKSSQLGWNCLNDGIGISFLGGKDGIDKGFRG
jgi:hypothetical protein